MDESNSFGVLGSSGRGLTEHYGVPVCAENLSAQVDLYYKMALPFMILVHVMQVNKLDIITAAMGHALATEGGFYTGITRVKDHQVWKCHYVI